LIAFACSAVTLSVIFFLQIKKGTSNDRALAAHDALDSFIQMARRRTAAVPAA
jgi:hypothetical protein